MNDQARLTEYGTRTDVAPSRLTEAQRRAYVAVRLNGVGVREHARRTDRRAGRTGTCFAAPRTDSTRRGRRAE